MSRGALRNALAILLVTALAAGCGGEDQQGTQTTSPQEPDPAGTTGPEATARAGGPVEGEAEGAPWTGDTSGGSEGAADRIREVEFDLQEGFERVRIVFGESDGIPRWSVEKSPEGGYVRLSLPGVTSTETAGDDLTGLTVDAFYVVRRPDGDGLFVDFLPLTAFEYRVTELPEAGQLAVDFRRAPGGLTCPTVQSEEIVVTQPCEAEEAAAGEPLAVEGYARNPGGSLSVVLLGEDGATVASETVRTGGGDEAWGTFDTSITVPPSYEGLARLRIRDQEPDDGVSPGAEVPVFFGVGQGG